MIDFLMSGRQQSPQPPSVAIRHAFQQPLRAPLHARDQVTGHDHDVEIRTSVRRRQVPAPARLDMEITADPQPHEHFPISSGSTSTSTKLSAPRSRGGKHTHGRLQPTPLDGAGWPLNRQRLRAARTGRGRSEAIVSRPCPRPSVFRIDEDELRRVNARHVADWVSADRTDNAACRYETVRPLIDDWGRFQIHRRRHFADAKIADVAKQAC
jgi:hypothetical protein